MPEVITDRGRVVAVLHPPPAETGLEKLRRLGLVRPGDPARLELALAAIAKLPAVDLEGALAEQRDLDR